MPAVLIRSPPPPTFSFPRSPAASSYARAVAPALGSLEIRHVTGTVKISSFHGLSQFGGT